MALARLTYENDTLNLSYELVNANKTSQVLILHGWGANKELMKRAFEKELNELCHIYVDLCGFGKSSIAKPLNSLDYAKIILLFLRQKELVPQIIIGHSFGGKIATLLSKDLALKCLVLLSSAGIVWQKSLKVRAKIALFKILKKLGFASFKHLFVSKDVEGMSEIMYETFKKVVDEDFSEAFSKVECKTLIFWGIDDSATPLKSGKKIHTLIKNSEFYPLNGGHFFFLENAKFIAERILSSFKKENA